MVLQAHCKLNENAQIHRFDKFHDEQVVLKRLSEKDADSVASRAQLQAECASHLDEMVSFSTEQNITHQPAPVRNGVEPNRKPT